MFLDVAQRANILLDKQISNVGPTQIFDRLARGLTLQNIYRLATSQNKGRQISLLWSSNSVFELFQKKSCNEFYWFKLDKQCSATWPNVQTSVDKKISDIWKTTLDRWAGALKLQAASSMSRNPKNTKQEKDIIGKILSIVQKNDVIHDAH